MSRPKDQTEELRLSDLIPGPPVPGSARAPVAPTVVPTVEPAAPKAVPVGRTPGESAAAPAPPEPPRTPAPATRAPTPATGVRLRQPGRRLWRAYSVTCLVVASYTWLRFRQWLAGRDAHAELEVAVHRRNARRIKQAIVELQGLFIKVGQLISIMANFLPEAFRVELEELQDKVPPRPFSEIEARLREAFGGRGPAEVFAHFEREAIASASIGQVHVARLHTGEQVAVKVQYPDIELIVRTDLRALSRIFQVLRWMLPNWGFETIYREIREMVLAELDYAREAEAMRRIADNFAGRDDVRVPRVLAEYSTARVLTTEWMPGFKVADPQALEAAGLDRRQVARLFVDAYCRQIFVDGFYHADPHPGNLLVQRLPDGRPVIVFLDFGATASLSQQMRRGILSFLQGAATRDTGRLVAAMKDMGFISRRADPAVFDRVIEYFHDRLRAEVLVEGFSLKDIKFNPEEKLESLLDLRQMNVSLADLRDAFHVPKEWVLLERALLLLLGVCTTLDPEMNPTAVIKPYVERFLVGEKSDLSEAALQSTREAALSALALPGELRRFLTDAQMGKLHVQLGNLHDSARLLHNAAQQLLWGGLGASAVIVAVLFDGRGQLEQRTWALRASALFGLLLARALWSGRKQSRRA